MDNHHNNLTPAEAERLAFLIRTCSYILSSAGGILINGYADDRHGERVTLEHSCGSVRAAMIAMCNAGDLDKETIHNAALHNPGFDRLNHQDDQK
ncbi:MAG: hypothetical protein JKY93_02265 [Gammaproteobacteria bacterium]|nr:hypothetical protein [Gammaproteobacteria bacterium]